MKNKNLLLLLFFFGFFQTGFTFNSDKKARAVRINDEIKIDGLMEEAWMNALPITDFLQDEPWQGREATQKTEVRILYDDKAIYVFATLYDTAPDSILKQLGSRDESPNADWFTIKFDTYNNYLDAYVFQVFSSGVQLDYRQSDESFNAVWDSRTVINENGWVAEIRIPYSALRFPKNAVQKWGLQLGRNIRRTRENILWSPIIKEAENVQVYWGILEGLENIEPPLRLSFTPYVSAGLEHYPFNNPEIKNLSTSYSGGLDLKYGINESFTLDMTLLPDFSQVQSDNKIKNLSAFETVYSEQRPFFTEAVDLFGKGSLFYSRRIGKTPTGFYKAELYLDSTETLIENPSKSKLVNSVKLSGRNKKGLAVGVFNAVTADTKATIRNDQGAIRHEITEPGANYNIFVLDQALKNNSSIYLTNSSFLRTKENYSSNVTAAGLSLIDKNNKYRLSISGASSQFYYLNKDTAYLPLANSGFRYNVSASKINGKIQYGLTHALMDQNFNANDLGVTLYNNYISNSVWGTYFQAHPIGKFKYYRLTLSLDNSFHYQSQSLASMALTLKANATLMNYLSFWSTFSYDIINERDYYEPRIPGMYFISPRYFGADISFSSDYRKSIALDGNVLAYYSPVNKGNMESITLSPIIRLTDHFMFVLSSSADRKANELGFAGFDSFTGSSIFGFRDIHVFTQVFEGRYVFVNDLSLSLRARHYWSKGTYRQYNTLGDDGNISAFSGIYVADFYFSSFNLDLVFSWQFSPGSQFSIVWKNEIDHDGGAYPYDYFEGFSESFQFPARNMISVKLLYYLDYLSLKKKRV